MKDIALQQSIDITKKSLSLLAIFVIVETLLRFLMILPTQASPTSFVFAILSIPVVAFFSLIVMPFVDAGLYGLVFLKVHSKEISFKQFTLLAKKNFGGFFRISVVIGIIYGLYWGLLTPILKNYFSEGNNYILIQKYTMDTISILIQLLFVFSFPLVIVGFFSNKNLKPIRSSLSIVFRKIVTIKIIIAVFVIRNLIGYAVDVIIPNNYVIYNSILGNLAVVPFRYLIIILSFVIITRELFKELEFDFQR